MASVITDENENATCMDTKMDEVDTKDSSESKKSFTWPCPHYKRLCKLQAACCSQFFLCRFCHDEVSNHEMDRYKVEKIECVNCKTVQGVCNKCSKCDTVFGDYFCPICRLYDEDNDQFHCDKCGLCRVGPKGKFYHCDKCNACLSKDLEGNHKCIENMAMSSCPICQEFLHTSRQGMHIPPCGHMIHIDCLKSYYQQGCYQCPMCKESLFDMTKAWEEMDQVCASVLLPKDLENVVLKILCQDCHKESDVPFNTEGLKCKNCGSYNTTQA